MDFQFSLSRELLLPKLNPEMKGTPPTSPAPQWVFIVTQVMTSPFWIRNSSQAGPSGLKPSQVEQRDKIQHDIQLIEINVNHHGENVIHQTEPLTWGVLGKNQALWGSVLSCLPLWQINSICLTELMLNEDIKRIPPDVRTAEWAAGAAIIHSSDEGREAGAAAAPKPSVI